MLLIVTVLAGCGKDDPVGPVKPVPFSYPALDTPQHTLLNLKYAWERRDSIRTREVYADEYIGVSPDPLGGPPLTFTKDQEVAVVWALGRDSSVVRTVMDLRSENTWLRLHHASDPEGWETIQLLSSVRLEVVTTNTTYSAGISDIEFKFKPTLDDTSPTDTTWKIVRWTEYPLP